MKEPDAAPLNTFKIADILGLGSAGSFILTIVYLYGYSITVRVNLFLYFGLNDYFRLAIQWLPPLATFFTIGVLMSGPFSRGDRRSTDAGNPANGPSPKPAPGLGRHSTSIALSLTLIGLATVSTLLSSLSYVPSEHLYFLWASAGAVSWMTLVGWYATRPGLIRKWTLSWFLFVWTFPAIGMFVFGYGLYRGKAATGPFILPSEVQILLRSKPKPTPARILFILDEYVVFRDQEPHAGITAVPRAEVIEIVHPAGR